CSYTHSGGGETTYEYDNAESYAVGGGSVGADISSIETDWISGDIKVEYNNGKQGGNPDIVCVRYSAVLPQIVSKMPNDNKLMEENIKYVAFVIENLRKILFLNPIPSAMRDYSRMNDTDIKANAENISSVLYNLCEVHENKEANKKEILSLIKRLPENEVLDIKFIKTSIGDVIFALQEKYGEELIDAKRISDGTIRCLAIITALISEEENSMVIIEEVDNGVHPSRARTLINSISEVAKKRNISLLITTHSPALLNALSGNELDGVSVCYRDSSDGSSKFVILTEMPEYCRLIAKGNIGDLSTKDEILKTIKNPSKKEKNYDWLGL
ncbi:MAG: AAA family ATPase, partial [bacterium]